MLEKHEVFESRITTGSFEPIDFEIFIVCEGAKHNGKGTSVKAPNMQYWKSVNQE